MEQSQKLSTDLVMSAPSSYPNECNFIESSQQVEKIDYNFFEEGQLHWIDILRA